MATIVYLVRHGRTESNLKGIYMGWSDEDINELGQAQSRSLSGRMAKLPVSAVYTSPLRRAHTTAEALAKPHALGPAVLDDLVEIKLGEWQGRHRDEIRRMWSGIWEQWRTDPSGVRLPDGESYTQVAERSVRAFHAVVKANQGKQAVIVSHEIVLKAIVINILGAPASIYRRFEIDNASLSAVVVFDDRARLIKLNDTAHFEA